MFMPSLTALIGTTFLIVLWQGGYRYLRGQMSLGALITFNTYLGLLVWPMIALGWVTNIFQRGAASMGRLNYILTAKPRIDDRAAKISPQTRVEGTIEFRNLNFTYPTADLNAGKNGANGHGRESKAVLKNIDLTIPAGFNAGHHWADGQWENHARGADCALWDAPEGTILIDGGP